MPKDNNEAALSYIPNNFTTQSTLTYIRSLSNKSLRGCLFYYKTFGSSFNPFAPDSARSKTGQLSKITNWVKLKSKQHLSKVLLNSFPMNGRT